MNKLETVVSDLCLNISDKTIAFPAMAAKSVVLYQVHKTILSVMLNFANLHLKALLLSIPSVLV